MSTFLNYQKYRLAAMVPDLDICSIVMFNVKVTDYDDTVGVSKI